MKAIFSVLLLIFFLPATAQEAKKDSAYVAEYYRLRALYLKNIEAKSKDNTQELYQEFLEKANFDGSHQDMIKKDTLINWVRSNLDKTDFATVEQAEADWATLDKAFSNRPPEETAYYTAAREAAKTYGITIMTDVMMNKGAGDKDPKEEPDYIAAAKKLKDLLAKQQNSDSYRNWKSLNTEYRKKTGYDPRKDKLKLGQSLYDWAIQDLSKTTFISQMEAQTEWYKVEDAEKAEKKENAEFHKFQKEATDKFGHDIYTDALMEVMSGN